MIAVQLYALSHVERELQKHGCERVEQIDEETALWKTPWDLFFTVPELGPDRMCPRSTLYEILADIESSKPPLQ
jgi:hypothetical protein